MPELQYYPPGFAWLGAADPPGGVRRARRSPGYQSLLWLAWLLPGVASFALLTRLLGERLARRCPAPSSR